MSLTAAGTLLSAPLSGSLSAPEKFGCARTMLCTNIYRRGAVYWYRRRMRLPTVPGDATSLSSSELFLSLRTREAGEARRRASLLNVEVDKMCIATTPLTLEQAKLNLLSCLRMAEDQHQAQFVRDCGYAKDLATDERRDFFEGRANSSRLAFWMWNLAEMFGASCHWGPPTEGYLKSMGCPAHLRDILKDLLADGFGAQIFWSEIPKADALWPSDGKYTYADGCAGDGIVDAAAATKKWAMLREIAATYDAAARLSPMGLVPEPVSSSAKDADVCISNDPFPDSLTARADFAVAPKPHSPTFETTHAPAQLCARPQGELVKSPKDGIAGAFTGVRPERPTASAQEQPMVETSAGSSATALPDELSVPTTITQVVERVIVNSTTWDAKTKRQARSLGRLLVKFVGVDHVSGLSQEHIGRFRDLFGMLPKSWGKSPRDAERPLSEILERAKKLPPKKVGLKPGTINRYMSQLRPILEKARSYGISTADPDKLPYVPDPEPEDEKRGVFSKQELLTLFGSTAFSNTDNDIYWIWLLGYHTGARLGEISGLRDKDVDLDEGVIRIRKHERRRVKTISASREIPIHSELRRLGFFEFVKERRRRNGTPVDTGGDQPLFSTIAERGDSELSVFAGKSSANLLDEVLPNARAEDKTFHSLRAVANTAMIVAEVPDAIISKIIGHAQVGTNHKHYFKTKEDDPFQRAIEKIPVLTAKLTPRHYQEQS